MERPWEKGAKSLKREQHQSKKDNYALLKERRSTTQSIGLVHNALSRDGRGDSCDKL